MKKAKEGVRKKRNGQKKTRLQDPVSDEKGGREINQVVQREDRELGAPYPS